MPKFEKITQLPYGTVGGGNNNVNYSFIGGGSNNDVYSTISEVKTNYSTISGGYSGTSGGDYDIDTNSGYYGETAIDDPTPKEKITDKTMDQYILSSKKLLKALEQAFVAGYESPVEMMGQEIERIYQESFAELHAVGVAPEKSAPHQIRPQVMFDTDGIFRGEWSK